MRLPINFALSDNTELHLSHFQSRKLLQKVVTRDTLNYRKLTDQPLDEESGVKMAVDTMDPDTVAKELATLAAGNRNLLPMFEEPTEDTTTQTKKENPVLLNAGNELYEIYFTCFRQWCYHHFGMKV